MTNQYHRVKIKEVIKHSDKMRSFVFEHELDYVPGQFVMVWLPGVDEKPISLSGSNMITVRQVGVFTKALFESEEKFLNLRGPYGQGFPKVKNSVAIGGGCGIAPLFSLVGGKESVVDSFVLAGRCKDDLVFLDKIQNILGEENVLTSTDDGSHGVQGVVTALNIPKSKANYYICGPEVMMKFVAEKLVKDGVKPETIFLSLERYMKCGVGICGNCSCSGYRICADGPVFSYDKILKMGDFNKAHRTRTGELVHKV